MRSRSFAPIARADARVLVLGSLPGARSLADREYYAQPQNAFWRIMAAIAGADRALPYAERLERLREKRIAVWDVCAAAERVGSLDTSIVLATVTPNRFEPFLRAHPEIGAIFLNGGTATRLFDKLVVPKLSPKHQALPRTRLPSTSPAHAGMPFARKLALWEEAIAPLIGR
ncbi:MAG: DNA-deoxyinosine glycosylase [Alphaproteobacteria bacterium]|nr:DNA-deoxyinosine glycosylase [Alphaproteobacteria bacterium]